MIPSTRYVLGFQLKISTFECNVRTSIEISGYIPDPVTAAKQLKIKIPEASDICVFHDGLEVTGNKYYDPAKRWG